MTTHNPGCAYLLRCQHWAPCVRVLGALGGCDPPRQEAGQGSPCLRRLQLWCSGCTSHPSQLPASWPDPAALPASPDAQLSNDGKDTYKMVSWEETTNLQLQINMITDCTDHSMKLFHQGKKKIKFLQWNQWLSKILQVLIRKKTEQKHVSLQTFNATILYYIDGHFQ